MRLRTLSAALICFAACTVGASAAEFTPASTVSIITHSGVGGANDVFGRQLIAIIEVAQSADDARERAAHFPAESENPYPARFHSGLGP